MVKATDRRVWRVKMEDTVEPDWKLRECHKQRNIGIRNSSQQLKVAQGKRGKVSRIQT